MSRGRGDRGSPEDSSAAPAAAATARLLGRAAKGDENAASQLMPLVYDELRRLAAGYLRRERPGQTLQATALVHEAYVRLVRPANQPWTGRTHFLAIAAVSMRQILVDRARRRHAAKRGGGAERITLDDAMLPAPSPDAGVDLRYFGGLTVEETAEVVGVSPATVKRHWTLARAFLKKALDAA
jgi:DNA-directed RNA polymerase specialized sigma24 family protein